MSDRHPRDRLQRQLTLSDATLLVVSSVIGVGIFLTPGAVADALPHPAAFLLAWLVGGLLSLSGALANAELGAMYPHAGGNYVYLREAWHPAAGFVAGWLSFFVIYAGTIATLAVGFAEGMANFVVLDETGRTAVAVAMTAAASAVNYRGVRLGATVNNVTAVAKIAALLALAVVGPALGGGDADNLALVPPGDARVSLASFGLALSPVLFSYLGWNASVFVASEIRTPARNVPRSLFLGLGICIGIYLLVNVAYLYALPIEQMRGLVRSGEAAARVLFGEAGAAMTSALILASILSCLNATILVGPRIVYAMALDGLLPSAMSRVHPRYATPHVAVLAQAITAIVLIVLLRRFPSVLDYTTFAIVLATMADTAALYALRRKQPHHARPYRAWGYPVLPALYLLANAAVAGVMLWGRPLECLSALAVASTAVPAYLLMRRRSARA
ncbi:MAG TPA: amino acid permease [Candidatus Limnocylindrales bacterium]|nr:amino acid permease [Candidatus Limnocylindrales bacterium]